MSSLRTQVGIVGAGPAGLLLAHLLHREGVESVVLEARSREHVEQRVRAGVLEQGTVDLLTATGVGERLLREGLVHHGIELRFAGRGHRIPLSELAGGRAITIYGQQEVVKDLIAARLAAGQPLLFEAEAVALADLASTRPRVAFEHAGERRELACDVVAGCDGFHGLCRESVPAGALRSFTRDYPFGWLGILAAAPPASAELVYAQHERGFALQSLRSPELSRLYLQCDADEDLDAWPDERIWSELQTRLALAGSPVNEGPILERGVTAMRSFVAEPMRYERLFLAGDAAHIVPPTGAKGLNLAVGDVEVLAEALAAWYRRSDDSLLAAYSATRLRRVWLAQRFSAWMTALLHRWEGDELDGRLQRAELEHVCSSRAAAASLAESYVGLSRTA